MLLLVDVFDGAFHNRRNRNRSGVLILTHLLPDVNFQLEGTNNYL